MIATFRSMSDQQIASDPQFSVWVSANAGTGKTKVLTDRVLRLLLAGTAPSRILCITYTKAAAAEMENRIHDMLSAWVAMDDEVLKSALHNLTDSAPDEKSIRRARSLFATVLDAPEGVRIQTVHSFCQSLLRRFPLEAGVQPHFEVIDERTALELIAEARMRLFARSLNASDTDKNITQAVNLLASRLAETTFQDLLTQLIKQRRNILPLLERKDGGDILIKDIFSLLEVSTTLTEQDIFDAHFVYDVNEESALRSAASEMKYGGKDDSKYAGIMESWWQASAESRFAQWPHYRTVFLTTERGARSRIVSASIDKKSPIIKDLMAKEQKRCMAFDAKLRSYHVANYSKSSIVLVDAMFSIYKNLKEIHQFLDYDDLVLIALRLLQREGIAPWVLYKLDGGLDHLLKDEAHDTSPEQWALVDKLIDEFFSGQGVREDAPNARTLFVVGDEKQSIYSFQGAAPRAFGRKRDEYMQRAQEAHLEFRSVQLGMSFRSTSAVLDVVDAVISQPHVQQGLNFQGGIVPHEAHRYGHAGIVEIWPVIAAEKPEQRNIWEVSKEFVVKEDSKKLLAERIANTVHGWLRSKEQLESQGRAIEPGDILVLVRSRNTFMHHLVRALKQLAVPVAGVDRMVLTNDIAVMDLLALAEFLLLPEDDLNLACILKSPLCNITEEQLFTLAYNRGRQSLWSRLQKSEALADTATYLRALLDKVDYIRPFELFSLVLETHEKRHSFAQRLGDEVFDPLDEFVSLCLEYERIHVPSLQGFLHWVRSGETEVKRDMEQGQNAVRIMTVHGSKGLQAPIVFLPDTTDTPSNKNHPPLWTEYEGRRVMLWAPSKAEDDDYSHRLREAYKAEQEEEYRRLLYVAMTRAEDRLYIGGWLTGNRKDIADNCWYRWIHDGAQSIMEQTTRVFGDEEVKIWQFHVVQSVPSKANRTALMQDNVADMPEYLRSKPEAEPYPPEPLVPSRSDDEHIQASASGGGEVLSPIDQANRFERGNVIHRILQWIPDSPAEHRREAIEHYLIRYSSLNEAERLSLQEEVISVLEDAQMAPVFASGSLAEVPVSGLIKLESSNNERILTGQIDRLYVSDKGVWVIDYKTQRTPPQTLDDVPQTYIRQMAIYRAALQQIYPQKPVYCALLWTAAPKLMHIPEDLLVSSLDSLQA